MATKQWNPGTAAVLSFLIPGAGQIYKGSLAIGFLWMICVVAGYVIMIVPGVILHILCIYKAYSGDPYAGDPNEPTPLTHGKCPECKEVVLKEATKCKHCGSALTRQTILRM